MSYCALREERDMATGNVAGRTTIEDFTQQAINDILSRFIQRPGEALITWMIPIVDPGAGEIMFDFTDCLKFMSVTSNPHVQAVLRDCHAQDQGRQTNLLALAAQRCNQQYPTDTP